jgi:hypothetical protein
LKKLKKNKDTPASLCFTGAFLSYQSSQQVNEVVALGEKEIKDSAGILPNSYFYSIELGIEKLQFTIIKNQEKLAALKAEEKSKVEAKK